MATPPVLLTVDYEIVLHKPSKSARFCVRANNLDASSTVEAWPPGNSWKLINQDKSQWSKGVIRVKVKYSGPFRAETIEADNITITVTNTDMVGGTAQGTADVKVFVDDTPDPP